VNRVVPGDFNEDGVTDIVVGMRWSMVAYCGNPPTPSPMDSSTTAPVLPPTVPPTTPTPSPMDSSTTAPVRPPTTPGEEEEKEDNEDDDESGFLAGL